MGLKEDLKAATEFIAQHRIAPVVSCVLDGLENVEEGFESTLERSSSGWTEAQQLPNFDCCRCSNRSISNRLFEFLYY